VAGEMMLKLKKRHLFFFNFTLRTSTSTIFSIVTAKQASQTSIFFEIKISINSMSNAAKAMKRGKFLWSSLQTRMYNDYKDVIEFCVPWNKARDKNDLNSNIFVYQATRDEGIHSPSVDARMICSKLSVIDSAKALRDVSEDALAYDGNVESTSKSVATSESFRKLGDINRHSNDMRKALVFYYAALRALDDSDDHSERHKALRNEISAAIMKVQHDFPAFYD
jgi:hypothetical protein